MKPRIDVQMIINTIAIIFSTICASWAPVLATLIFSGEPASQRASEQASEPANLRAIEQASKPASEQARKRATKLVSEHASEQASL